MSRTRKLVVAGLIIGDGADAGRILISQRRADQAHPLGWEFPGGKIEAGESPELALGRELAEELGVEVRIGRIWDVLFHAYPDFDVLMLVYPCRLAPAQTVRAVEVAAFAWVTPAQLADHAILPADAPLVARLQREGLPTL
jgi:8-oxo-dGTP diphosphatase